MIEQLDESIEDFLRGEVPLSREAVAVSFDAPDKEWGSGVTQPTLNLFLWDIRRSAEESESGMEQAIVNGSPHWRVRPPRYEFRYLVTAWAAEILDEHRLLGAVLPTLVNHRSIPPSYLKRPFIEIAPHPTLKVGLSHLTSLSEFWSAIEGKFKTGLDLIVTATIDPAILIPAGAPTEEIGVSVADSEDPDRVSEHRYVAGSVDDFAAVGALVRTPVGTAIVQPDRSFLVRARPGDDVVVETPVPKRGTVPERGAIRIGDP